MQLFKMIYDEIEEESQQERREKELKNEELKGEF